jgi:HD superfamily phosphohydrolase YqeK
LVRTYSNKDDDGAWISVEAERRMEHVTGVTQLATKTAERVTEKVCGLNH